MGKNRVSGGEEEEDGAGLSSVYAHLFGASRELGLADFFVAPTTLDEVMRKTRTDFVQ